MDSSPLRYLVEHRDQALREIHHDADVAKKLVNSLIHGGSVGAWRERHGVCSPLPTWTKKLTILLQASGQRDTDENPGLKETCRKTSSVTFWLNCMDERLNVDAIDSALAASGTVVSYEADGLFYVKRTMRPNHWAAEALATANTVAPCSLKPVPSYRDACAALFKRWAAVSDTPPGTAVASSSEAAVNQPAVPPIVLATAGEFNVHKLPNDRTKEAAVSVPQAAMESECLFDGGKGRQMVLVSSSSKTQEEAFKELSAGTSNAKGVMAASMAADVVMCLVVKDKNTRLQINTEHYQIKTLTPTKVRLTDARLRDVYESLEKHQHTTNIEAVGHDPQVIPDFEQMCTWLADHLKTRKYMEIVFECKRLVKMKTANVYEKALVEVAPQQMKEFADHFTQAYQSIRRVDDQRLKTYPRDFTEAAQELRGVFWNDETGIVTTKLSDALDAPIDRDGNTLATTRTLIFVGRQNCGKTTLLRALARELANRQGFEVFADSTALDPFGVMTRAGLTKDLGAICLNDFELKSCLNQDFSSEMLKALLDVGDCSSYNARYHVATLPGGRARMWAVNPEGKDEHGNPDWGSWFRRETVSSPLAWLANESGDVLKTLSECEKAIVRRAVIFRVQEPLFDAPRPEAEDENLAKRRKIAEIEGRYQL